MALSQQLIRKVFPKTEFAFFGNYINRYKRQIRQKQLPSIDLILAVDNSHKFHEENSSNNPGHYTYFARSTGCKVVHKMQEYGARVHFNHMTVDDCELSEGEGEHTSVQIRYGVINLDDMLRDLQHWETLLTSSFMQRPFEILEKGSQYGEIEKCQRQNLQSALAYAALTTPNGADEKRLYETIVEIPHYQQKRVSYLLDKEDEETVVDDSIDAFRTMYLPLLEDGVFRDCMEVKDGKFYTDVAESKATQKLLHMSINDNVHKNLDGFSIALFDADLRWNKEEFSSVEKGLIVEKLIENDLKKQEELIFSATDRILYTHRNLKLFMFLTSGPFFLLVFLVKGSVKLGLLYFLYNTGKKSKEKAAAQAGTEKPPAEISAKINHQ